MTNGGAEQQRSKIKRFGLEEIFDVILVEGESGFGKPDSQVYAMALDSLKLEPNTVWSVGDNLEWDVWGPQQLGIYGIWNDVKNWDFQILLKSFLTESYALLLNWSKLGVHSRITSHTVRRCISCGSVAKAHISQIFQRIRTLPPERRGA